MWFFSKIWAGFKALGGFFYKVFKSQEAQEVFQIILEQILPEAKPIVERLRAIVKDPANTDAKVIFDLYEHFNIVLTNLEDNGTAKANALLNLATQLVDAATGHRFSTPLLHSAIELALSGVKAEEK